MEKLINQKIKQGVKTVETFNGITVTSIESKITIKEALSFADYLRSICKSKGTTVGTIKNKTLSIHSNWYQIEKGDLEISHIEGVNRSNKTNYHILTYYFES